MWVFNVRTSTWYQVFVNSVNNPSKREYSTMVTVKPDRLVLLYGGQYAETLHNDVWQYNVNTNMWAILNVQNELLSTLKNCTTCTSCTTCAGSPYFKR
mmetsp:Transcript_37801/g.36232  ORF Transcript_37801/g.36232 Transcript_37801/m.36232 type:complete len:98 (+) Transcript_37801:413-706(+)